MDVSVIIVNYKVRDLLFKSIESIYKSRPLTTFEIIVVDNDERKNIKNILKRKFPKVIYVPNQNKGFGQANNSGVKQAKGKYLFFLNPDTEIYKGAIDSLLYYVVLVF
jgi:GT2 family glycosyltransferase